MLDITWEVNIKRKRSVERTLVLMGWPVWKETVGYHAIYSFNETPYSVSGWKCLYCEGVDSFFVKPLLLH